MHGISYIKKNCFLILFIQGKLHEDEYMINELLFKCKKVVYINKELYYYLQRESSIMGSGYNLKRLEGLKAIEERYLLCKQYKVCEEKALVKMLDSMIENYLNVHKYYNSEKVILGDLKEKIHNYSKEGNNFRFKTKMKYKIFCFSPSMYKILVKILYE